jgi:hypothetical protein
VIVLFEHAGRRLQVPKYNTRAKFSLKQFMEKHNLGECMVQWANQIHLAIFAGAPLAANFFISKNAQQ